jgi:hypothetical protein
MSDGKVFTDFIVIMESFLCVGKPAFGAERKTH